MYTKLGVVESELANFVFTGEGFSLSLGFRIFLCSQEMYSVLFQGSIFFVFTRESSTLYYFFFFRSCRTLSYIGLHLQPRPIKRIGLARMEAKRLRMCNSPLQSSRPIADIQWGSLTNRELLNKKMEL